MASITQRLAAAEAGYARALEVHGEAHSKRDDVAFGKTHYSSEHESEASFRSCRQVSDADTEASASEDIQNATIELGMAHCNAGNIQQARIFLEKALRLHDTVASVEASSCGTTGVSDESEWEMCGEKPVMAVDVSELQILLGLAFCYGILHEVRSEWEMLERAVSLQERADTKDAIPTCLLLLLGQYGRAESTKWHRWHELLERSRDIQEKANTIEHQKLHNLLIGLCNKSLKGSSPERLKSQARPRQSSEEETIAQFFAALLASNGNSLAIGSQCCDLGHALEALAALYHLKDDLVNRNISDLQKVRQLADYAKAHHGPESTHTLQWLALLADVYGTQGDFHGRQEVLSQVLNIQQQLFGFDSLYITPTLKTLAHAAGQLDNLSRKWELLNRAAELQEDEFGNEHAQTRATRFYLRATAEQCRRLKDPNGERELSGLFPRDTKIGCRKRSVANQFSRQASWDAEISTESSLSLSVIKPFLMAPIGGGACVFPETGGLQIPFYCNANSSG